MYLDGVIKSNASYSLTCTNKNLPFYIGGGFSNGSTTSVVWNGKIDDVCIYNRALNANEVTVLYNGTNVCFNVGVKELEELANFQVFPTASAEGLFTALSPVKGRVEIYSAGGQFIKAYQKQEDKITIDLKNEASGVYFLRLVTGEGVYTRKLIKE